MEQERICVREAEWSVAVGRLRDDELEFIKSWPRSLSLHIDGFDTLFMHGSPADPTFGYVYPDTDLELFGKPADFGVGRSYNPKNCRVTVAPGTCRFGALSQRDSLRSISKRGIGRRGQQPCQVA